MIDGKVEMEGLVGQRGGVSLGSASEDSGNVQLILLAQGL